MTRSDQSKNGGDPYTKAQQAGNQQARKSNQGQHPEQGGQPYQELNFEQLLADPGLNSGSLDVAELKRLADSFFKGVPASEEVINSVVPYTNPSMSSMPPLPTAPASMPTTAAPMPTANAMPSMPAFPSSAYQVGTGGGASGFDSSGIPMLIAAPGEVASAGGTGYGGVPFAEEAAQMAQLPFGFLNEIRPMFSSSLSSSAPASSSTAGALVQGERLANGLFVDPGYQNAADLVGVSAPQISGAIMQPNVAGLTNASNLQEQQRLEDQVRKLSRIDVVPVLEPILQQPSAGAATNLGFLSQTFDVESIRRDFPILQEQINGYNLVWLDNAATTQKPQSVIDRISYFYTHENSNIHRAAHELAARSTDAYEAARESTRRFLNAPSVNDIVFVRGATEAINLVAQSWGRQNIQKDDEVLITWLEHHANIVPWQMVCAEKGARLKVAPVDDHGQIILEEYERLLSPLTRLVSLTHVSNALGTVTPVKEMVAAAHRYGARVLVDGAQAVSHMRVDVQEYDCDFYVFSGHKVFAPTGIGVLYGKSEVLETMRPWQGGGNMIKDVTFERTIYNVPPVRFEAGTGSIADAVGLGAALDYLDRIGMANVHRHENELMEYGMQSLKSIPGLHLIGTAPDKAGVLSFVLDGFRTEDVSSALNQQGIAVRAGHHCAQPILRRFGLESTVRPSLALYNTCEDIDALIAAIWNLKHGRGPGPL